MNRLLSIMARLRDPERGCPWDRQQSFASVLPFTLEETYEVVDAIESGDMQGLREELGDLLFQIVFYAQLASEQGHFRFRDVAEGVAAKLVRRHPHVFEEASPSDEASLARAWEARKAGERAAKSEGGSTSLLDGVAKAIPALRRAEKLQRRAATVGFDWKDMGGVLRAVREELEEVESAVDTGDQAHIKQEIGDLLFATVNLARFGGVDPESALRAANAKFERRFRYVEDRLAEQGRRPAEATLAELDAIWIEAKRRERPPEAIGADLDDPP